MAANPQCFAGAAGPEDLPRVGQGAGCGRWSARRRCCSRTSCGEDRPITDFIGADYTFVNERLAKLYGIDGVEGDAFVKVKLPANRPGGMLGQASFLTITSNPTRTSPVKRGKYVLENSAGDPAPASAAAGP